MDARSVCDARCVMALSAKTCVHDVGDDDDRKLG